MPHRLTHCAPSQATPFVTRWYCRKHVFRWGRVTPEVLANILRALFVRQYRAAIDHAMRLFLHQHVRGAISRPASSPLAPGDATGSALQQSGLDDTSC